MIGNNGPDGLCGRKATFEEEARGENFALLVALLLWGAVGPVVLLVWLHTAGKLTH